MYILFHALDLIENYCVVHSYKRITKHDLSLVNIEIKIGSIKYISVVVPSIRFCLKTKL